MEIISVLLQNRESFLNEIIEGKSLKRKIIALLSLSFCAFFAFGFIIGLYHSIPQALSSGFKMPVLYLLTLTICFPALFIFNSLFGSKQSIMKLFAVILTSTCIISLLLVGFAPVTLFFLLTTNSYQFFKLLNVGVFCVSGIIGVIFLHQAIKNLQVRDAEGQNIRMKILKLWLMLYAFVGCQLGWTLRPFFGYKGLPFEIFRDLQDNFYSDIISAVRHLLGFH